MSLGIELFFNFDAEIGVLRNIIFEKLGIDFRPFKPDPADMAAAVSGFSVTFSENYFENDGRINFEDYGFLISVDTAGGSNLRQAQLSFSTLQAYCLCTRLQTGGILVFDGQVLLADYEPVDERTFGPTRDRLTDTIPSFESIPANPLYDKVSQAIVVFPQHFNDVYGRLHPRAND